jgi:N-methylhydantoinase B/acetone carboxylase, alpha subunit
MVSWEVIHRATAFIAEEMGVALREVCPLPQHKGEGRPQLRRSRPRGQHSGPGGAHTCPPWLPEGWRQEPPKGHGEEGIELEEGDMLFSNDPYITGTHLTT